MLENEPTTAGAEGPGENTTTEQTPKVTRRRRAASRPAGPPPEEAEREAGLLVDEPPRAATPVKEPETAATPASEPAPAAASGPASAEDQAATAVAIASDQPETAQEPKDQRRPEQPAKPTRRTRTRKTEQTTDEAAPAEETTTTRRTRTRRRRTATGDDTAAQAAEAAAGTSGAESAGTTSQATAGANGTAPQPAAAAGPEDERPEPSRREPRAAETADANGVREAAEKPGRDEDTGGDAEQTAQRTANLLADPFGLATQALSRAKAPGVVFQAPSTVLQPIFQAPEPIEPRDRWDADDEPEPDFDDLTEADEAGEPAEAAERPAGETTEGTGGRRRRRRRGGRNRNRNREAAEEPQQQPAETTGTEPAAAEAESGHQEAAQAESEERRPEEQQAETAAEQQAETAAAATTTTSGSSRRRRRRRRRAHEADSVEPAPDDPPNTVVRIRQPRTTVKPVSLDEVQGVRGSTRLEAKKQRRREGRELGRRRSPIITESEFLARRESVERVMVVRRRGGRTQIAVLEDGILVEHYVDRHSSQSYVGNVYLGKVQNVLPSMEAAFIDIGKGRNAVLYAGEVNFDSAGLEGQPKRIESALKSGQSVLVQVTKDPIGHKGARLTSQISLPGRYLVYVPDGSMTGISRKLPDKERARLKSILKKVMPENAGVIVRTAAEGATEEELSRDVARLSAQWENIQRKAKSSSPPELLYSEPDLTIRVVRDVFNEDFKQLVVAGDGGPDDDIWDTVHEYVKYVAPHLLDRVTKWEGEEDVFAHYRIDEQIAKALERKVWLPSGGSLVIDRTEAMTVIDVNTGKFTGQGGNLEETVTRNNLEAAEEIVRQLRLRDIGGIIVIDFIDMVLESNRDLVLRRMLECLARDRTKHQVAEVTSLGLVQMTRKRVGQGLLEAFSTPCECCGGRGLITSLEPVDGKPEPRGTQGKMAIEKAVAEKVAAAVAARDTGGEAARESVTGTLTAAAEEAEESGTRSRRRSRAKVKQAE